MRIGDDPRKSRLEGSLPFCRLRTTYCNWQSRGSGADGASTPGSDPAEEIPRPADVIAAALLNAAIVPEMGCRWIYAEEMD